MNVEELTRQVEAKPAPVPLLAVQAFANTLDVETSTDLLESRELFADWLERSEFAEKGIKVTEAELVGARRLRASVRDLLIANERGEPDRKAGAALAEMAGAHPAPLVADPEGHLAPDLSPVAHAEDLIGRLLAIIFHAQSIGTWERLKLCENPECLWSFYDSSRNRSGSWCRTGLCGNRIKNRAYRERQRGAD
jgi:predicted RNA-binding Zn ribbon-like protein